MSADDIVTPARDFDRNHNKWPLIIPQDGSKPIPYRRVTKYISVLEDNYMLDEWGKRQVAIGLSQREDLRLSVLAHLDDKKAVNQACRDAKEYALSSAAATKGTAFHSLTDIVDRGLPLPKGLPGNVVRTLDKFRAATEALEVIAIEPKTVLDSHKIAGTPDRIYGYRGAALIGDSKTGKIRWGTLKIATQLAAYARSWLYDVATGARTPIEVDMRRGVVMDIDLEAETVDLVWVDLQAGWDALMVCKQVWAQRSRDRFDKLTKPFTEDEPFERLNNGVPEKTTDRTLHQVLATPPAIDPIRVAIATAGSSIELNAIWAQHQEHWTEEYTALGRARVTELEQRSA